jgi:regulator of protease activity HflC (stomatin/prohibitin superfamily)
MLGSRVIRQFEHGVVRRCGKAQQRIRGPGLIWINPITDRLHKGNLQIVVSDVTPQDAITRDHVTVTVDAAITASWMR